jgi:hypothetical protein
MFSALSLVCLLLKNWKCESNKSALFKGGKFSSQPLGSETQKQILEMASEQVQWSN